MAKFAGPIALLTAIVVVIGLFFVWIAGTGYSTNPDQVALHYKAGPFTAKNFAQCIDPSDRDMVVGIADEVNYLPAGQRTYEFSTSKQADTSEITSLTKDNIELTVNGVMRFSLNTDCKDLQKFWEEIGRKFGADMDGDDTSEGWRNMLRTYPKQALQRAVNEATQSYNWKELYNDSAKRKEWEQKVDELLPSYIKQAMGGDYFNEFNLTIQKPRLPQSILNALEKTQAATEENNAQKALNEKAFTELDSIKELVKVLGPNGYNVYKAIQDGKVSIIPVPTGTGINVNPK